MIKEAEMREHAKIKGREIAKNRLDPNFKKDNMQAISSSDYENTPAKSLTELQDEPGATGEKLRNLTRKASPDKQAKNTFQAMLEEQ